MSAKVDRDRLSQTKILQWFQREVSLTDMITVYLSNSEDSHYHFIYCALIPFNMTERVLLDLSWDLSVGDGLPSAVIYHGDGEKEVKYLRYGSDHGIEPLVIEHEFYGMRDNYKEISEEFRLFHRLYHDRKQDRYIKIDNDGNEHLVAIIESNRVQIRLKEIRQFLAIKEMHLSIQFDYREHSLHSLEDLEHNKGGNDHHEEQMCWGLRYGDLGGISNNRAFSRLLGKRLIGPLQKSKSGFWGFAEDMKKKHIEFIIGIDDNGDELVFTSNPDALANNFGANPTAPHYLTPVQFRKQVLDKYFQQPTKFSVEDSILRCGYLWSMYLDNHHDDKVCVWLGDLGRDLPYEEQLHWRAHNVLLEQGISETYYKRQILAEFTDSSRPEHLFRKRYDDLKKACDEYLGWQLLLELGAGDQHHFQCVRIPATDEQRDFDELILGLTKILIDSLNEKKLNKLIPADQRIELKGSIALLETALTICGIENTDNQVLFLRKLQSLRSSSAAHRKGSNYQRIAKDFNVENQNLRSVFAGILWQALAVLDFLVTVVCSGRIKKN